MESKINNIKHLCKRNGIKLYELAEQTGLSYTQVQHLAVDRADLRKADFETILKLCSAFKCKPQDLFVSPFNNCVKNWHYTRKNWGR